MTGITPHDPRGCLIRDFVLFSSTFFILWSSTLGLHFNFIPGTEDRVQYWQARWATGQSQWHSENPHKFLTKVIFIYSFYKH